MNICSLVLISGDLLIFLFENVRFKWWKTLFRESYFIYITDAPQKSEIFSPPDDGSNNFLHSVMAASIVVKLYVKTSYNMINMYVFAFQCMPG